MGLGKGTRDLLTQPYQLGWSPWQEGSLTPIVISDIYGIDTEGLPLSRGSAITIPAVSKARNLLVSTIAKLPLYALDSKGLAGNQPTFLYRSDTAVTPYERMAWTVDDLIFYGYSLWLIERGEEADGRKPILRAEYCPMIDWEITNGKIIVNEQPIDAENVILFNSPFEGLLNVASRTLRGAKDLDASWIGRARNPIPMIELHQNDDTLDDTQVAPFVEAWSTARRSENGAIGYTPPSLSIITHGEVHADLMVEGRNAVRTDIGSFLNIRASMLDGTMGIDSLTYSTTEGERNSFFEFDLPFWTDPIEARLSMDDIVPRGQRVRFDRTELYHTPTATGAPVGD